MNLVVLFSAYLNDRPLGEVLTTPGVIFSQLSGVVPDVVFISNERRKLYASGERITGAPDLVIEVVSPGAENARRDCVVKRQLYGKYGIREYWVVDPELRTVDVYVLEGETLKAFAVYSESNQLAAVARFRVRAWRGLSLLTHCSVTQSLACCDPSLSGAVKHAANLNSKKAK